MGPSSKPPPDVTLIDELAEQVSEQVEVEEEAVGWATFCRDGNGLYYEGRCVRGHIKDCASQLKNVVVTRAFKSKVSNRVYVETDSLSVISGWSLIAISMFSLTASMPNMS